MSPKAREIVFGLVLSLILNSVLSAIAPILFGGELTLIGWGMGVVICTVIAMIMVAVLPIDKMQAAFAKSMGTTPDTVAGKLLGNALLSTLFGIVLVFAMVAAGTGFGDINGVPFIARYLSGIVTIWPVVFVTLTFSVFLAETIVFRKGAAAESE